MAETKEEAGRKDETGRLGRATAWVKGIGGLVASLIALFALLPDARKAACGIIHCSDKDQSRCDNPDGTRTASVQTGTTQVRTTKLYIHIAASNQAFLKAVSDQLSERATIRFVDKANSDYIVNIGNPINLIDANNNKKSQSITGGFILLPSNLVTKKREITVSCDLGEVLSVTDHDDVTNSNLRYCLAEKVSDKIIEVIESLQ